jgi:catechol 2,3-dioxygenase-like lactoylglutathione lyase family enzyme
MIKGLHHVGIVTANIEDAIRYYVETFGCPPPKVVTVDKPGIQLRTAMLSIGASHLQLIEPKTGPGVEELQTRGEGAILEVAFQVDDIEQFYDEMSHRGISPVSMVGAPIDTRYLAASSGNRYFYLPQEKTRGTSVEIIQVMSQPG